MDYWWGLNWKENSQQMLEWKPESDEEQLCTLIPGYWPLQVPGSFCTRTWTRILYKTSRGSWLSNACLRKFIAVLGSAVITLIYLKACCSLLLGMEGQAYVICDICKIWHQKQNTCFSTWGLFSLTSPISYNAHILCPRGLWDLDFSILPRKTWGRHMVWNG